MNYVDNFVVISLLVHISRVSCQKGPTRHAYAWQIRPFWQDTLDMFYVIRLSISLSVASLVLGQSYDYSHPHLVTLKDMDELTGTKPKQSTTMQRPFAYI